MSTPSGRDVSDDRPEDHPWHLGLGIAVANIGVVGQAHPVNLWGGPTYSRGQGYVQLPNHGSQRVRKGSRSTDRVVQRLEWCAADDSVFLAEERSWHAQYLVAAGTGWLATTVRSRWVNTSGGPLTFGSPTTAGRPDAGYGGFFLRLPRSFDGAAVLAGSTDGAVLVGEADAMGSAHSWLGLGSQEASVLMLAGGDNPGGASPWFVRSTGTPMLCAAPFFHEEMPLEAGGVLDWTWSLLAADGLPRPEAFAGAAGALTV